MLTFSESVVAIGTPQVELNIGGTSRMAQYGHLSSGRAIDPKVAGVANPTVVFGYTVQEGDDDSAGGATVVFSYTVAVGDADTDGIAIGANKLTLNEGTIKDAHGNAATLTHDAVDRRHRTSRVGPRRLIASSKAHLRAQRTAVALLSTPPTRL